MSSNIMTLPEYIQLLNYSDYRNKDTFRTVLKVGMVVLLWSEKDCASIFDASRSSVNSWVSGRTAPHTVMRKLVFRELLLGAREKYIIHLRGH